MRSQETRFNIPESRYLRSGQFAALCRTTKETLRHYRAIGLIEPAFVSDSGYAYYSPLQLGDFMLVAALQRAGPLRWRISTAIWKTRRRPSLRP